MPNYAKINIIGHAGRDPEVKKVGTDTVANFSVAVKTGRGEKEITTWYDVAVWGKSAESYIGPYLKSGNAVFVCGEPRLEEYTKKDGTKGAKIRITADSFGGVQILTSKDANGSSKHDEPTAKPAYTTAPVDPLADQIPF